MQQLTLVLTPVPASAAADATAAAADALQLYAVLMVPGIMLLKMVLGGLQGVSTVHAGMRPRPNKQ